MDRDWRKLTDYLIAQGIDAIEHTDKTYLAHLVAVYRDLEAWGCDEDVCRGGMFHSIYGTELFQGFKLPLEKRAEIRALIGERAERLGYLNCAMDRGSFDQAVERGTPPYLIRDRITGAEVELAPPDFDDLCTIHLCDWLEQVGRAKMWDYRAAGYRNLAERLGGVGKAEYDRVYAAAPQAH